MAYRFLLSLFRLSRGPTLLGVKNLPEIRDFNMRNTCMITAIILCLLLPSSASAGSSGPSNISNLIIQPSGQMFFDLSASHTGRPSCATSDRWVINTSNLGGQAAAAAVLTAFSMKKAIGVQGNATCDVWGDTESVSYVIIPN